MQSLVREKILQHHRVDVSAQPELVQELRKALIAAKHQLSEAESATLRFPLPNGAVFAYEFTRAEFDALIRPIVDRTMGPVKQALADAHLSPSEIDEVVLVGGTTRTPLIRATKSLDLPVIRQLLDAGADPNRFRLLARRARFGGAAGRRQRR